MHISNDNLSRPILGIDPGFNGGLAFLYTEDMHVDAYPMPTVKNGKKSALDKAEIARLILCDPPSMIVIEKVSAMPGQGVSSMFSFGYWAGFFEGLAEGLKIPILFVTPQAWMKDVLVGQAKGEKASVQFCQRLWPKNDWRKSERSRIPHDGMTDASCIALHGHRKFVLSNKKED